MLVYRLNSQHFWMPWTHLHQQGYVGCLSCILWWREEKAVKQKNPAISNVLIGIYVNLNS